MSLKNGDLVLAETPAGLAVMRFEKYATIASDCAGDAHVVDKVTSLVDAGLTDEEQAVMATAFADVQKGRDSVKKGQEVMKTWTVRTKKD